MWGGAHERRVLEQLAEDTAHLRFRIMRVRPHPTVQRSEMRPCRAAHRRQLARRWDVWACRRSTGSNRTHDPTKQLRRTFGPNVDGRRVFCGPKQELGGSVPACAQGIAAAPYHTDRTARCAMGYTAWW